MPNSIATIIFSAVFSLVLGISGEWMTSETMSNWQLSFRSTQLSNGETVTAASPATAELADRMDKILQDTRLAGAVTGVSIRYAESGELLYSHMGDIRLHPASNMKILTAIAALDTLGADYRFMTEVRTDGTIRDGVLDGNLYLRGKGDPTLMQQDLDRFAQQLQSMGIQRITGHLIGDDSWYDDIRLSQDLNWSDEPYYTGAQISALTLSPNTDYDAGTVIVEVTPAASVGDSPQVKLTPDNEYVTVINHAETLERSEKRTLTVEREHGSNKIIIEGGIPAGSNPVKTWASVWEPSSYALDVFWRSLAARGITFDITSERLIGETPERAELLTSKQSIPLQELIIPFMKLSNNGHGETLTKEMGKIVHGEGTWDKGLQVIKETIMKYGVDGETIMLRDGSGMSHKTMIPADELSKLLYAIQGESWYNVFEHSLPVAGATERLVGGTLRSRMIDTAAQGNVKAKTGSLTSVSSLSGYVTTKSGERLIFAVLINNYLAATVRPVEDAIAVALAELDW